MYKKITLLACIISISLVGSVFARNQTYTQWTGTEGGDWSTASNWSNSVPLQLDTPGVMDPCFGKAGFKNPPTNNSPGITASVTVATDQIVIGSSGGGTLTVSGGTINVSEFVNIGNLATDKGTLNMNGGTLNCGTMIPADGRLIVGNSGQGTINMNSGTINLTSYLSIADLAGSIGNVHLDGGTIYATDLLMNTASAHLDIRGGTLILDGDDIAAIDGFVGSGKISAYDGTGTVIRDYNVTNSGKTTVTGYLPSPKAINPNPFHTATNVALDANLSWTAGLGAASHNVYFGTDSTPDETEFQGNQPGTTFDPCTLLAPATAYYWRIDEVNEANVVTTGDVWSFTTISGQPSNPSPADYATGVAIHPILSWTPGQGALSHDVYLDTVNPPTIFRGNQPGTTFDPCNLLPATTYYWRIDEVYSTSTITGPVWSFTTANTKATILVSQFCPAHGATGMPIGGIILTWTAGYGAVSHDVYFGTASSGGTFQVNQPGTSFALPTILTPNTTYYWRIDEKDGSGGTTVGDVNNFTTGDPVGIYPYLTWRSDPTSSVVVNWWNPATTGDSSVDYGMTSDYGSTANVPAVVNYHHVELTGLSPSTTYYYQIRSSDGTVSSDPNYKFTTAEVNTTSFRFAMYGDPRGTNTADEPYYTRQGILCDWILAQDFDFAVETGDTVWAGASLKAIGKWWPDFFRIEGNLTKSKVVMHTLGNHECQEGSYWYWVDFYKDAYPTNGMAGTNGRVFSFDYGTAHFVCLATSQVTPVSQQVTWLIADLTAAKANPNIKWIFVFFHAPMFTTSGHPNRTDCIQFWGPVFDQFGVNAVFQGHNHVYERTYPLISYYDTTPITPVWTGKVVPDGEGTVYVTDGMGGAEFNNGSADPKFVCWFGASNLNTTVVTSFTINGNRVTVEAIRNDTGAVIDTFELAPRMLKCDFNKDGVIDMKDLGILVGSWLDTGMWP